MEDVPLIINEMSGKYFGLIVDASTNILSFHVRDIDNVNISEYKYIQFGSKKIIYVDLTTEGAVKSYLYLTGTVKIYDIFLTDEIPTFNLIPYEFNEEVEWEDLYFKERSTSTGL